MPAILRIARFISQHPLTRDQKVRAFARFVRWQVNSRLKREVVVRWIEGTFLAVRRGMAGATGNIYCGLHEFNDMAFLLHFLRSEDTFADVGANIGSYTILASGICRAHTRAFEPDPITFAALARNIAVNGLEALVTLRECALGATEGKIRFTLGLDTMNRVVTDAVGPSRMVLLDTLDHALDGEWPSLIKLDVEGFESEVLRGAAKTLSCSKLKAIIIEDRSQSVIEALHAFGFVEHSYDPFTRQLKRQKYEQSSNLLFVRDDNFVRKRLTAAARVRVLDKLL
jgi:FkbM family methyltransferase